MLTLTAPDADWSIAGSAAVDAVIGLPEVGFVSFTGSVSVGRQVHASAARRFIDCTLELGGNDAAIIGVGVPSLLNPNRRHVGSPGQMSLYTEFPIRAM